MKIVQDYIREFDGAFEKGDLSRCNIVEETYDTRMRVLGVDPIKLHEFIVDDESVEDAVNKYLAENPEK